MHKREPILIVIGNPGATAPDAFRTFSVVDETVPILCDVGEPITLGKLEVGWRSLKPELEILEARDRARAKFPAPIERPVTNRAARRRNASRTRKRG